MNRRIRKKQDKKITEAINGLISIAELTGADSGRLLSGGL